jgi:hypothetical protein
LTLYLSHGNMAFFVKSKIHTVSEILENVSDSLLENCLTVNVDVYPTSWLHGKFQQWGIAAKKKVFLLRPIHLGVLIRISKLLVSTKLEIPKKEQFLEWNYQAIESHGETLAMIIALAIRNNKKEADKSLVRFILANFTAKEIFKVLSSVLQQMDLTSFMSSIISIKGMNVLAIKEPASVNSVSSPEVSL